MRCWWASDLLILRLPERVSRAAEPVRRSGGYCSKRASTSDAGRATNSRLCPTGDRPLTFVRFAGFRAETVSLKLHYGSCVPQNLALQNVVADIAAAYFRKNHVAPTEISTVIAQIAISLSEVGARPVALAPEPPKQAKPSSVQIRKSITRDALISFEDNKPYKSLRRHLAARDLSPQEYRIKWGLPEDYPMAAPSYREARASLAKAHGFGGRRASSAEPGDSAPSTPPPGPASSTLPAAPAANATAAGLLSATARPDPATKPAPRGLSLQRKPPSTPTAFRPRDAINDPAISTRHKNWLAMLTEADWARVRAIARQVNHAQVSAAVTGLSAPLRIRACLVGQEARFSGETVGTLRGGQVAVLISEHGEH